MTIIDKTDQIAITLPDGSVKAFTGTTTGQQIAASIGNRLAAAAIACKIDGKLSDLDLPITRDASVQIVTRESPEALELIRHDAAHVIAEAVQELYPGTQVTIGPAIDNGFYYDFARDEPFTTDDLAKIEAKMREIIARNAPFTREVWDRTQAIEFFKNKGENYKAEIIQDLPGTEQITIYRQGEWLDLCRGPHMPSTGQVGDAFKLTKVAGAYWRGDHRNAMLQRIYGVAFCNKKELDAYLLQMEEAEKRDHRRLGKEMDLFHMQEESPGAIFWHPKGWTLWMALENYIRRRMLPEGYSEVRTPQLIDSSLFKASGHWEFYADKMFKTVEDAEGGRIYGLKPMNCPGHVQIFKQGLKSYRDLPIRYAEFTPLHRNESSGSLHGLLRVRAMSQDDAHIFCTMDQIQDEALRYFKLNLSIYQDIGFDLDRVQTKLALRPDERGGTQEGWDLAEEGLRIALRAAGLPFEEVPGEGAFYGPKVEFHLTDAIGRQWQCGTLQLDFVLPERLDASYIGEDGAKHRPVMLHRAALGSLERFIGILIEHYAGKFPLWLAPLQVVVATITGEADGYAEEVRAALSAAGIRVEADLRNEKINYKVREHSLAKVPIMLVVGKREAENRMVAMRRMDVAEQPVLPLDQVVMDLVREAAPPA